MKLKTVALIFILAIVFVGSHFFFREEGNQALLLSHFQLFGSSISVARLFVASIVLAALIPSVYFSTRVFGLFKHARTVESSQLLTGDRGSRHFQAAGLLDHGDYEQVLNLLEQDQSHEGIYWRAHALLLLKRPQETLTLLGDRSETAFSYLRVQAQKSLGNNPESTLRNLIAENPATARNAYVELVQFLDAQERWLDCYELVKQMKSHGLVPPEGWSVAYHYQWVLTQVDIAPKRRIEQFQQILKEAPNFVPANLALGDLYMETKSVEKAFRVYEQAFESTDNTVFLERLELFYLGQGRPEDVLSIYRQLLVKRGNASIKFQLGRLYFKLGMFEECDDLLSPLKGRLGHLKEFQWLQACSHMYQGRHEKAVMLLKEMVEGFSPAHHYACSACHFTSEVWQDRCPKCSVWGTSRQQGELSESAPSVVAAPVY